MPSTTVKLDAMITTKGRGGKRTPGPGKKLGPPRKPLSQKKRAVLVTLPPDLLDGLAVLPGSRAHLIEKACREKYNIPKEKETNQ